MDVIAKLIGMVIGLGVFGLLVDFILNTGGWLLKILSWMLLIVGVAGLILVKWDVISSFVGALWDHLAALAGSLYRI